MKTFYETSYTREEGVMLLPIFSGNIVEIYMESYDADTKKRLTKTKRKDYDGYYFKSELIKKGGK